MLLTFVFLISGQRRNQQTTNTTNKQTNNKQTQQTNHNIMASAPKKSKKNAGKTGGWGCSQKGGIPKMGGDRLLRGGDHTPLHTMKTRESKASENIIS